VEVDAVARQQVDPAGNGFLEVIDISAVQPSSREAEARRLIERFIREAVDLSVGPLFCPKIFKLSVDDHVLVMGLDHMITDGVSNEIMNTDLWTLYHQAMSGREVVLAPLPVQFADYAVWLQCSSGEWIRKHKAYWHNRLKGAPKVQIPAVSGAAEGPGDPARHDIHFGDALSTKLRGVARDERILLCLVVLTVYVAAICRWCRQRDLVVLLTDNGRDHPYLAGMVGFLAYPKFLRIEIGEGERWHDLLAKVKAEYHAACDHNDFGRVRTLTPLSESELYFNWMPASGIRLSSDKPWAGAGISVQEFPFKPAWHATFTPFFSDGDAGIIGEMMYRKDLFPLTTMEHLAQRMLTFAEELVAHPWSRVFPVGSE